MRKIFVAISLLIIFIFLVSCAPPLTDEELQAELAKLTPEEREQLLADLESKEGGALAGQALKAKYVGKVSPRILRNSNSRINAVAILLKPDLIVEPEITYQSDPRGKGDAPGPENIIKVTALIKNIGTVGSSESTVTSFTYYQFLEYEATKALYPGEQTSVTKRYECVKDHQLAVFADHLGNSGSGYVLESNEDNNAASIWIICPKPTTPSINPGVAKVITQS